MATHPQKAAGIRIEPPVSVPIAAAAIFATIAAPEPPLEPPGMRSRLYGLRHVPQCGLVLVAPLANSCRLSLPNRIAPAACNRVHMVQSKSGTKSARILEPPVVRIPRVLHR